MSLLDPYFDGRATGQHDALSLIDGSIEANAGAVDYLVESGVQMRFRLWCLASNLAIAAGMCRAFNLGGLYADNLWNVDHWSRSTLWRPGCQRSVP